MPGSARDVGFGAARPDTMLERRLRLRRSEFSATMRHRRPDSNREPGATAIGVRISRSIWCRILPPNRGSRPRLRRNPPAVLLTAITLQAIHRINRHQIAVNHASTGCRNEGRGDVHASTTVPVCTLASIHAITSVGL